LAVSSTKAVHAHLGGIELPFGGMKKSGHGREKGFAALHEFSALRTLVIRHD
jgi:aldehyde dehydrogenase (NAD+)